MILLSLLFVPLDGRPHADWLQFLGRFHPLLVHFPIGLIVLLLVLETLGIHRPPLREAAGLVLKFALAACLVAILFGLLLAYGSGESGTTVTLHLRGGVLLAIELLICVAVRRTWLQTHHWGVYFPLLADFEPKGDVAKKYGAYRANEGYCERALFVIDEEGKIFWSYCSPVAVNPGADGILEALEELSAEKGKRNDQVKDADNAA